MQHRRGFIVPQDTVSSRHRQGILFVISGPSGVGKTSLCRQVIAEVPDVTQSVSYTTRPPRPAERHGREYRFVSQAAFQQHIDAGEFLEWAEVHGCYYGTSRQQVETLTQAGVDVLLAIDVQGAAQLRTADVDAVFIFLIPPSWEVLISRIQQRGSEALEVQKRRLTVAREELAQYTEYDYIVVNDQLVAATDVLKTIIMAEHHHVARIGAAPVAALLARHAV